jgi:hypothetical protein
MTQDIGIVNVERDGDDGVIVTFSDGTADGYLAEELLEWRPCRQILSVKPTAHTLAQMLAVTL